MPGVEARGRAGQPRWRFDIIAAAEVNTIMSNHITRIPSEIDAITATAERGQGSAVLMLNLNHYTAAAGFPDGSEYKTYMAEL